MVNEKEAFFLFSNASLLRRVASFLRAQQDRILVSVKNKVRADKLKQIIFPNQVMINSGTP
jgi:hypothetical protein